VTALLEYLDLVVEALCLQVVIFSSAEEYLSDYALCGMFGGCQCLLLGIARLLTDNANHYIPIPYRAGNMK